MYNQNIIGTKKKYISIKPLKKTYFSYLFTFSKIYNTGLCKCQICKKKNNNLLNMSNSGMIFIPEQYKFSKNKKKIIFPLDNNVSFSLQLNKNLNKLSNILTIVPILRKEGSLNYWDLYFIDKEFKTNLLKSEDDNCEPNDNVILRITL